MPHSIIKEIGGWYAEKEPDPDPNKDKGGQKLTVEIDGQKKEFTPDDVTNLINQQASATQKTQKVAAIMQACDKYGIEPDVYLGQAEGAFSVMSDLINKGIIDNEGKLIEKKPDPNIDPSPGTPSPGSPVDEKTAAIIAKTLAPLTDTVKTIASRIDKMEDDQVSLLQMDIERQIKEKHPDFSQKEISHLLGVAASDRTKKKSLWDFAEDMKKEKAELASNYRAAHAKEFGVNLEDFDANKLDDQDGGGGAAAFVKGKKMTFKRGVKDGISPKQATIEFMKRQLRGGT